MAHTRPFSELDPSPWMRAWLTETVRLREAHWGPLDDVQAQRIARQYPGDFCDRVQVRAQVVGEREGLRTALQRWRRGGWLAWTAMLLLACMIGAGAAAGALGDGIRPVNIVWALGTLLGVHGVTFVLWLATLLWSGQGGHGLASVWLWLMRKIARGPHAALIPTAFMSVLGQAGVRRSFFGVLVHGLWAGLMTAAVLTLIVLLSTAQYQFAWSSTLLAPDRFVSLTRTLGTVPSWFGFPMPDAATVRASDGRTPLSGAVHMQWSLWLLGVVVVYGWLPRVIALGCCVIGLRRLRRPLPPDPTLPGIVQLRDALTPAEQRLGVDTPATEVHQPVLSPAGRHAAQAGDDSLRTGPTTPKAHVAGRHAIVALEPDPDAPWPPFPLAGAISDFGRLDSREQRVAALDQLAMHPAGRLLVVSDSAQTPDRGSIALVTELADYTDALAVWIPESGKRADLWRDHLARAGLPAQAMLPTLDAAIAWLDARP